MQKYLYTQCWYHQKYVHSQLQVFEYRRLFLLSLLYQGVNQVVWAAGPEKTKYMGAFVRSFLKAGTDLLEQNDVIDYNSSPQDDVHGHEIEKKVEVARNASSELFEIFSDISHKP